jgi:hypothetical protein
MYVLKRRVPTCNFNLQLSYSIQIEDVQMSRSGFIGIENEIDCNEMVVFC